MLFLCFFAATTTQDNAVVKLGSVTENGGTVRHEQEVDSDTNKNDLSARNSNTNNLRLVEEVELTSTRSVDVTGRLVAARV